MQTLALKIFLFHSFRDARSCPARARWKLDRFLLTLFNRANGSCERTKVLRLCVLRCPPFPTSASLASCLKMDKGRDSLLLFVPIALLRNLMLRLPASPNLPHVRKVLVNL